MHGVAQDSVAWDKHESHAITQRNTVLSFDIQDSVVSGKIEWGDKVRSNEA